MWDRSILRACPGIHGGSEQQRTTIDAERATSRAVRSSRDEERSRDWCATVGLKEDRTGEHDRRTAVRSMCGTAVKSRGARRTGAS